MSDATTATSRRDFLIGTGLAAGAAALVSAAATGDAAAAERANCAAVHAMLPVPLARITPFSICGIRKRASDDN
jgi:hypothetical protein